MAQRLRLNLSPTFKFGCIHFEGKFIDFPRTSNQPAFHDRIDNINNCVRSWGVDAKATRDTLGHSLRSNLHPRLEHFVGVGVGGQGNMPCFHLDPDSFLQYLVSWNTKVLYDGLLVQELYNATQGERNGISTWHAERGRCVLSDVLRFYCQDSPTTLVLVLSPSGEIMMPSSSFERRDAADIWCEST